MIFVYDYHPGSETLLTKHFSATELNGYTDPFSSDPNAPRPYSHTKNTILRQQHSSMLPESVIWSYIIQLTAALRVIHAAGLYLLIILLYILFHFIDNYIKFLIILLFRVSIQMFRSYKSVTHIANETSSKLCSYTRCCYL